MTSTTHTSPTAADDTSVTADVEMLDIDRSECLRLLAECSFGRVAVTMHNDAPVIRPINYIFDVPSQSVVFRTGLGTKLHALILAKRAVFEIDSYDGERRTGWSVIVSGVTESVSESGERARLERHGPEPLAPGAKHHLVRIRVQTVSGRRIAPAADAVAGYRA